MSTHLSQFQEQQQLLRTKQAKLSKKARHLLYLEWILAGFMIAYVVASITYWNNYSEILLAWPMDLQILLGVGVCIGFIPLAALTMSCEFYRETLVFRITMAEQAFDIAAGVQDAMREYFGEALPEYAKHLNTFGLAHEALAISQEMSKKYDQAFSATQLALKTIDEHMGLGNMKHEALKAQVLAEMLKPLLETLRHHQDVANATQASADIADTVVQLEDRLKNLK